MADNVQITAGSGTTISTEDVGAGIQVQRVKVTFGPDGTATNADVTAGNGFPINFPPATPTVSGSASVTSLILKAGPTSANGGVKYFHAENATNVAGYCILYNGTIAPSTGALTAANVLAFQSLPAGGFADWTASNNPIGASIGAVVLLSSAADPFTYTTGTITGSIYGLAQ